MKNYKSALQAQFHFCPRCGSRLRLQKTHEQKELICESCNETFWMGSKPTASVILVRDNNILLAERGIEPFKGWWDVPGGFLEPHENPEKGAKREMKEELAIHVSKLQLIGMYIGWYPSKTPQSTFNVVYYTTTWTGKLSPHDDVSNFAWFPLSKLPKKIAFINNKLALLQLQKILRHASRR